MSRPQLYIFHSYVWCDIKCTKQCRLKLLSDVRRRTGPVSSRQGNELDRIDPYFFIRYFFGWLADFLVGDAQECRVQQYFYLEVRIVFVNILHTRQAHHILPPSFKRRIIIPLKSFRAQLFHISLSNK